MTIRELRSQFHSRTLEIRAIDRLLDTDKFSDAYNMASEQQQKDIESILKSDNCRLVRQWILDILSGPVKYWSFRRLRDAAKNENVPRYSRLDRDALIKALEKIYAAGVE